MCRVAVVTGGVRGIGAGISLALKEKGYQVIATYQQNDQRAKEFHDQYGIEVMKFDVGDFNACKEAFEKIREQYGGIDILVNNAGITRDGMLHKMTADGWSEVIRTNLDSVFNMTRLAIDGMRERGFGRIINISSINAQKGQAGQTNYCAAKSGIIGFTKALALETSGKGITVNAIAPGYIDTDMVRAVPQSVLDQIINTIPVKRLGRVDEIASMVIFLSSDESAFVTGSTMNLNGGQYMG